MFMSFLGKRFPFFHCCKIFFTFSLSRPSSWANGDELINYEVKCTDKSVSSVRGSNPGPVSSAHARRRRSNQQSHGVRLNNIIGDSNSKFVNRNYGIFYFSGC